MNTHKLILVAGARPNFMKLAPLYHALIEDAHFTPVFVHTGQHYDDLLSGSFLRDLRLPPPDHYLGVGSGSHAQQTAEVMKRFEPVLEAERPEAVVVVGDVNSTVAAALVAAKMQIPVVHVEAGLRSFDRSMPEEINRLVTDAISDLLLVTEESGRTNLLREGVPSGKIHLVGNFMIDSLVGCLPSAQRSDILERIGVAGTRFGLVTLHRPANVDDGAQLAQILEALEVVAADLPLVFPVHPRTRARLNGHASGPAERIRFIDPLGYLDFLCLMAASAVVLTDSGGIQEETTALRVPCLTLRDNTERPVTIEQGSNTLAGTRKETILAAWHGLRENPKAGRIPPLWDGGAARRAVQVLRDSNLNH
jgi:UDP-N-acetylglucosamine 2-epimerase (non-hydrolysing)